MYITTSFKKRKRKRKKDVTPHGRSVQNGCSYWTCEMILAPHSYQCWYEEKSW